MMKRCDKLVICIAVFCSVDTSIGMDSSSEESENRINISNNIGSKDNINLKDNIGIGSISQININDSTCMESQDQINITDIFGSKNKNIILNYDDLKPDLTQLKHELSCLKERVQLMLEALCDVQKKTKKLGVSEVLYQDPVVRKLISDAKNKVYNQEHEKFEYQDRIHLKIEKQKSKEIALNKIISERPDVYNYALKRALDTKRELQSDLYQTDQQIEEAQKEERALKDEYQRLIVETIEKLGLQFISNESNGRKDLEQQLRENDNLKKELEERQANLGTIEQSINSMRAEIQELKDNLSKWTPNLKTYY